MCNSVTPWAVVSQAPLSLEFSRQEYWGGSSHPGIEAASLNSYSLGHRFFTISATWEAPFKGRAKQVEMWKWPRKDICSNSVTTNKASFSKEENYAERKNYLWLNSSQTLLMWWCAGGENVSRAGLSPCSFISPSLWTWWRGDAQNQEQPRSSWLLLAGDKGRQNSSHMYITLCQMLLHCKLRVIHANMLWFQPWTNRVLL